MFRKITAVGIFALLALSYLLFMGIAQSTTQDFDHYIRRMNPKTCTPNASEQKATEQKREGVQKDFWSAGRHIRLKSPESHLSIVQHKDTFEMTEQFGVIESCMQDEAKEELRWLTAKEGVFHYPANTFEAKDANLLLFTSENTDLPEKPPEYSPQSSIAADVVHWIWEEELDLTGHVRVFSQALQEKSTFAIADTLHYSPSTGHLELESQAPNKVLLWQENMRLSSPAVEILTDSKNGQEQIKGIGDVHFYFTGEEEALFYKVFGIKN